MQNGLSDANKFVNHFLKNYKGPEEKQYSALCAELEDYKKNKHLFDP